MRTDLPIPKATKAPGADLRAGVWPLATASEMKELDRHTIEDLGIDGQLLMESAGRGLFSSTLELLRRSEAKGRGAMPIRVLCGAGNNGGDGFVLARHLHAEGIATEAILVGDPSGLPDDAARNWERLRKVGVPCRVVEPDVEWATLLDETAVVVDALFGTGLGRAIEGALATRIEEVNRAHARGLGVLAVDMPSGICAQTGQILGVAIEADCTVTISLPKVGLALEPGRSHAGVVRVARVGIADPDPDRADRIELWNARKAASVFPARPPAAHKGSFGHVLVVAGSPGKLGAAGLCARAAARSGAGLVTVAYPEGVESELGGIPIEVMTQAVPSTLDRVFAPEAQEQLSELAAARDAVALGPGLGRQEALRELLARWIVSIERPLVIDADGLFALRGQIEIVRDRSAPTVLTPHPGEAATLLERDAGQLNRDRVGAARELARRSGAVVVLKGAATVVADASGRVLVTPTGGPALATGGTGDVLTGIVAALLAAGMAPFEAAGLAAWWHGATADRLVEGGVSFGLLAGQLADALPDCAREIMADARAAFANGAGQGRHGEDLELRFPGP